jgi:hypothetical protein
MKFQQARQQMKLVKQLKKAALGDKREQMRDQLTALKNKPAAQAQKIGQQIKQAQEQTSNQKQASQLQNLAKRDSGATQNRVQARPTPVKATLPSPDRNNAVMSKPALPVRDRVYRPDRDGPKKQSAGNIVRRPKRPIRNKRRAY